MVYESATVFPTPEGAQLTSPPPVSTYGFQKLASEYFAKGAWEQYQLPYTIVRPFNCVGIGERRALRDSDIMSGNVKLALSHVVPDLVHKVLKGQDPLHILGAGDQVRHYTYGGDLAHGIRLAMESPAAVNDDFNLSTAASTTVLELAEAIWHKVHTDGRPFRYVSDTAVRARRPAARARRPQGPGGARLRGDDDPRPDARRGHPVDPGRIGGRPAVMARRRCCRSSMPVFKEGEAVEPVLRSMDAAIAEPHEILVVYDFDEDPTVPVIDRLAAELPAVRGLRNDLGRGVLNAMKAGIAASAGAVRPDLDGRRLRRADVVDPMVALARDGADVVAASRYMRGGHQVGGPPLKRLMSRTAGLTLHWFAGVPTHDPTNNFKLYSRRFLDSVTIESTAGFELALELTVKATIAGRRVAEVPTTWRDRTAGAEQLQAPQVAAALPALVPGRRSARGRSAIARRGRSGASAAAVRGWLVSPARLARIASTTRPDHRRHGVARQAVGQGRPEFGRAPHGGRVTVRSSSFAVSGSTPGPRSPVATTTVARVCAARSANRSRPSRRSQTFQTSASVTTRRRARRPRPAVAARARGG